MLYVIFLSELAICTVMLYVSFKEKLETEYRVYYEKKTSSEKGETDTHTAITRLHLKLCQEKCLLSGKSETPTPPITLYL